MKKTVAILLVLMMALCACTALADTDKEIQFNGHTFGETLEQTSSGAALSYISQNTSPYTPRVLADPIANWLSWAVYGNGAPVTFQAQWYNNGPDQAAGYNVGSTMYYYYPSLEDAAALNLKSAVFYAGAYDFWEGDPQAIYDDLKAKLTTVYGEPSAEGDGDAVFGGPLTASPGNEEYFQANLEEVRKNFSAYSLVSWKSTANNAMAVLVYFIQNDWANTKLYYFDMSAEEKILEIFNQSVDQPSGGAGVDANDTSGL